MDAHRLHHVGNLIGNCLQRRTDQVRPLHAPAQAVDHATCVFIPPGCPEAGKRWHKIDAKRGIHRAGQGVQLMDQLCLRQLTQAGAVCHPCHRIAGVGDIALQPVDQGLAVMPRHGGGQRADIAERGGDRCHHRRPGAVGCFHAAFSAQPVGKQRGVGITDHRHHRQSIRDRRAAAGITEQPAGGFDIRQRRPRDAKQCQHLWVPVGGMQVHQLGAGGVSVVAAEGVTLRQLPQQPAVYGAQADFTPGGALCAVGRVIQQPAHFGA